MQLEVGKILEGKVTGITKFGAFVELEPGTVGMVHISEISNTYVNDINEILKNGQTVTVKVLSIGEDKKISLSIKRAMAPAPGQNREGGNFRRPNNNNSNGPKDFNRGSRPPQGAGRPPQGSGRPPQGGRPAGGTPRPNNGGGFAPGSSSLPKGPASFEDMLSKFISSSDEKISGLKKDHAVSRRGGSKRK